MVKILLPPKKKRSVLSIVANQSVCFFTAIDDEAINKLEYETYSYYWIRKRSIIFESISSIEIPQNHHID